MSITFQKRQKEMKRQEKQRAKAERREQRKAAKHAAKDAQSTTPKPSSDSETSLIDADDIMLDPKTVFDGEFAEQSKTKETK